MSERSPPCEPLATPRAPGFVRMTSSVGVGEGSVLMSTLFSRLKIAALAPMPSASDKMATHCEPRTRGENARRVAKILVKHVTMLPECGGDEIESVAVQIRAAASRP